MQSNRATEADEPRRRLPDITPAAVYIYITKEDCSTRTVALKPCSSTGCPPLRYARAAAGSYSGGRGKQLEPFRRVEPERLVVG